MRIQNYLPQLSVPVLEAPPVAQQGTAWQALDDAASRAASAWDKKFQQDGRASAAKKLAQARLDFRSRIIQAETDGDIDDYFTNRIGDEFQKYNDELLRGAAGNDYEKQILEQGLLSLQGELLDDTMRLSANASAARKFNDVADAITTHEKTIALDPSQYGSTYQEAAAAVANYKGSDVNRAKLQAMARGLAVTYFNTLIKNDPEQAVKALRDEKFMKGIDIEGDKIVQLLDKADAEIAHRTSQFEATQNKARATAALRFNVEVTKYGNGQAPRPQLSPETVAELGEDNALRAEAALSQADKENAGNIAAQSRLSEIIGGSGALPDPNNDLDKKAADLGYRNGADDREAAVQQRIAEVREAAEIAGNVDEEEIRREGWKARNEARLFYVDSVGRGIVPETLKGEIRGGLNSGSIEQRVEAADLYARIVQKYPMAAKQFSDDTVELARTINANRELGQSDKDAVANAVNNLRGDVTRSKEQTSDLLSRFTKLTAPEKPGQPGVNEVFLQNAFGGAGWFGTNARVRENVQAAFEDGVRKRWLMNGNNLEAAQKATLDTMRSTFNLSYANGKPEVMREAPELYFKVPGLTDQENGEWIRKQAIADAWAGSAMRAEDRGDVEIRPMPDATGQTRQFNGRPVYMLVIKPKGQGREQPVVGKDGVTPQAWQPDPQAAAKPALDALQAAKAKAINDAKAKRELKKKAPTLLDVPYGMKK